MYPQRTEFEGIDLGKAGQPRQPVVEAFRQRGVLIPQDAVSSLREIRGDVQHSGNEVKNRLLAAQKLGSNNANLKDSYYLQIAETGVSLRTTQERESHRWSSRNFTESIAEALNLSPNGVRLSIRAMRTDLTYMELDELLDQSLVKVFIQAASEFIDAYTSSVTSRTSAVKPSVVGIKYIWDAKSIASFYSSFYNNNSYGRGLTIGIWTPYEVEIMKAFYQSQTAKHDPLTSFDTLILQSYAFSGPQADLAIRVRAKSKIDIDHSVVASHRNALLFGQPFNSASTN